MDEIRKFIDWLDEKKGIFLAEKNDHGIICYVSSHERLYQEYSKLIANSDEGVDKVGTK